MQNDREVRSREGDYMLITSHAYKKQQAANTELITTQPISALPISYQPQKTGTDQALPLTQVNTLPQTSLSPHVAAGVLRREQGTSDFSSISQEPAMLRFGGDGTASPRSARAHGAAHELSYVHEFSEDCAINGPILEYYESGREIWHR